MAENRRFFCDISNFVGNNVVIGHDEYHHLCGVLRAKVGDRIIVCSGDGSDYFCEITDISNSKATLVVIDIKRNKSELSVPITLFQATLKSDKMEFIIQKAVELGVGEIVPFKSRYVVGSDNNKNARYNKIAVEAVKQCGRAKVVEVKNEIAFLEMVNTLDKFHKVLFCNEVENRNSIYYAIKELDGCDSIAVIVGCEGGFSDLERELLTKHAKSIALGRRILRAETAAISVLAVVSTYIDTWGEL